MNPILSVIVAVHNTSLYLEKCIVSLLSQDFRDLEIICVNDASTDNSLEILNYYASCDERIVVIDLKENVKLGGARNRGIDVAKGQYLGFVDSDDYVSPKMYSSLLSASNEMTADIVTPICYADFTGKGSTIQYQFSFAEQNEIFIDREEIQRQIVKGGCRIWASIFKTKYIRENNLRFAEKVFYEDFPMFLSLFLRANTIKVLYNREPLYYYRVDNKFSIVHGIFSKEIFEDRISGAIQMYEDAKTLGIDEMFPEEFEYKLYRIFY